MQNNWTVEDIRRLVRKDKQIIITYWWDGDWEEAYPIYEEAMKRFYRRSELSLPKEIKVFKIKNINEALRQLIQKQRKIETIEGKLTKAKLTMGILTSAWRNLGCKNSLFWKVEKEEIWK